MIGHRCSTVPATTSSTSHHSPMVSFNFVSIALALGGASAFDSCDIPNFDWLGMDTGSGRGAGNAMAFSQDSVFLAGYSQGLMDLPPHLMRCIPWGQSQLTRVCRAVICAWAQAPWLIAAPPLRCAPSHMPYDVLRIVHRVKQNLMHRPHELNESSCSRRPADDLHRHRQPSRRVHYQDRPDLRQPNPAVSVSCDLNKSSRYFLDALDGH